MCDVHQPSHASLSALQAIVMMEKAWLMSTTVAALKKGVILAPLSSPVPAALTVYS